MKKVAGHNNLFEMLRSFTKMAETLNLSQTVRELNSTRQTVRRHIDVLEETRGEKLFVLEDRQYKLTEAGQQSVIEADDLLSRGTAWLAGEIKNQDGLEYVNFGANTGDYFYQQQHSISRLWERGDKLLQDGMQCWTMAKGQIEDPALAPVRPYLVVFKKYKKEWICIEIGHLSAYATWFGKEWEKSAVGRALNNSPTERYVSDLIWRAYTDIHFNGGVQYDHIHTRLPRGKPPVMLPANYQRLLLGFTLPLGQPIVAILACATYDIDISHVSPEMVRQMPKDALTKYPLSS